MHSNSRLLFEQFAQQYFKPDLLVLEIGPDRVPSSYTHLVSDAPREWHTLDIAKVNNVTFFTEDPYRFPIRDDTYDIVLSGQVLEHVDRIWVWMKELARVTKPGGVVITIAPSSWPHHEAPLDCWRVYPPGLIALCEDSGLEVEVGYGGSLETPRPHRVVPGRSQESLTTRQRRVARVMELLRLPVERSFDTIVIARKPEA